MTADALTRLDMPRAIGPGGRVSREFPCLESGHMPTSAGDGGVRVGGRESLQEAVSGL